MTKQKKLTRTPKGDSTLKDKEKNVRVTVRFSSQDELERVTEKAKNCGFGTEKQTGVSSYLKAVALGYNPPSIFDYQVLESVADVHIDLVRIGNLLKGAVFEEKVSASILMKIFKDLQKMKSSLGILTEEVNMKIGRKR